MADDHRQPVDYTASLPSPPLKPVRIELGSAGGAPSAIGRYRLLEKIGTGGFGDVFLAEQREPIRRRVAVKIISLGMHTEQVVARFELEQQALALMDHPNVAHVFDAGVTDDGRPYFVMEYVPGEPITRHCDERSLNIRQRLKLFVQVCHAVGHAHQKALIHRDIKPSNILVAIVDDRPVVKLIDFGVAKALSQPLTERTVHTSHKSWIGTLPYLSPEQASGRDIDTRTDIYALGVVLYKLLTGTLPFDGNENEILEEIQNEIPARPSVRLKTMNWADGLIEHRGASHASLVREAHGGLDWIAMKALEKDRASRYSTALELAVDVQHYLDDEPLLAGPPGMGYRLRTFVRRHRIGILLTLALALAAALAAAGLGWGWLQRRDAAFERAIRHQEIAGLTDFILDLDDEIRVLPGSESVRQKLLLQAVLRLDRLAEDVHDPRLLLDLAWAYGQFGRVLDGTPPMHADEAEMALRSYQDALGICDGLNEVDAQNPLVQVALAEALYDLGRFCSTYGDSEYLSPARRQTLLRTAIQCYTRISEMEAWHVIVASPESASAFFASEIRRLERKLIEGKPPA